MKKSKLILPLALTLLLTGCAGEGGSSVSSSDSSSSSSSSVASSSDSSSSSSSSSESEAPKVTIADLETLAAGYVSKENTVSNGSITTKEVDAYSSSTSSTSYKYGSDSYGATLGVTTGTGDNAKSLYVVTDSNGKVLTLEQNFYKDYVSVDNGAYTKVAPKFVGYLENRTAYGAADFLSDLVAAAKKNVNKDLVIVSTDGNIAFSFGYYELDDDGKLWTYYSAKVSVADDKTSALASLKVEISQYNSGCTLDASTGIVTVGKDQKADKVSTYSISQTVGERSYVCPASITNFEYKTFALKSGEADVTSESNLTFSKSDSCVLSIVSTPDTANGNFDTPVVTAKKDGVDSTDVKGEFARDSETKKETVTLTASMTGEYDVTVKTKSCTVTFKVTVTGVDATKLSIRRYTEYVSEEYDVTKLTDNSTIVTYTGATNYFVNTVEPTQASQNCTITVTESPKVGEDEDDPYEVSNATSFNETTACSFVASAPGNYKVSISSDETPSIKKDFTIEVIDGDSFTNILSSSSSTFAVRSANNTVYKFDFTPNGENDDCEGKVSITEGNGEPTEYSYILTKGDDDSGDDGNVYFDFAFKDASNEEADLDFSLILGADRNLYIQFTNSYQKLNKANSVEFALEREWSETIDDDGDTCKMYLTFKGDGTVEGLYIDDCEEKTESATEWTIAKNEDGSYKITFADDGNVEPDDDWTGEFPTEATLSKDLSTISWDGWSLK